MLATTAINNSSTRLILRTVRNHPLADAAERAGADLVPILEIERALWNTQPA